MPLTQWVTRLVRFLHPKVGLSWFLDDELGLR